MKSEISLGHTVGACIVCIVIYLLMIYLVTPILDKMMTWFGVYFIPESYGGGAAAKDPGLISLIIRGLIQNGISAYCAIKGSMAAFSNANERGVAVVFGIFIVFGAIMFTYLFKKDGLIALITPIMMAPALYFALHLWKGEEI